jgi:hypothetical protein
LWTTLKKAYLYLPSQARHSTREFLSLLSVIVDNAEKSIPAQQGKTFRTRGFEVVGVAGHLQALFKAVQGLKAHKMKT